MIPESVIKEIEEALDAGSRIEVSKLDSGLIRCYVSPRDRDDVDLQWPLFLKGEKVFVRLEMASSNNLKFEPLWEVQIEGSHWLLGMKLKKVTDESGRSKRTTR